MSTELRVPELHVSREMPPLQQASRYMVHYAAHLVVNQARGEGLPDELLQRFRISVLAYGQLDGQENPGDDSRKRRQVGEYYTQLAQRSLKLAATELSGGNLGEEPKLPHRLGQLDWRNDVREAYGRLQWAKTERECSRRIRHPLDLLRAIHDGRIIYKPPLYRSSAS